MTCALDGWSQGGCVYARCPSPCLLRFFPQDPPGLLGRDKEAEGRAQGSLLLQPSSPGFYRRDAKKSQKLPHCVQDSPAPRRKRSHSRGAWSPWQHQEPKTAAGWRRGSWAALSTGPLARTKAPGDHLLGTS
nr:uncharacterized protein LOC112586590 isoform X2 [Bubalus bubalis]